MNDFVEIVEVAPRDGLQNEAEFIDTAHKVRLIDALSICGFRRIEIASFVNPKRVPQMADGELVLGKVRRRPSVRFAALVPNLRGLQRAVSSGVDEIAVFASTSEGFSRANTNMSVLESIAQFRKIVVEAAALDIPVRGYASCVISCPYDGPTPPQAVASVVEALLDIGCHEVSLGDTIGSGEPSTVSRMLDAVLDKVSPDKLAGHFHDTSGTALANVALSIERGLRVFDSAVGGLGGCPFAPGAAGNVASEKVNDLLISLGFVTGVDADMLSKAAEIAQQLRRPR